MKPSRDDFRRARLRAKGERGTWADTARAVIARVDADLPPGASLEARRQAIDAAYPFGRRCHYPYRVWCRVRRAHLAAIAAPEDARTPAMECGGAP